MTERVSTENPAAYNSGSDSTPYPGCEHRGRRHAPPLTSKDRRWWWLTGLNNLGLLLMPALLLADGVKALITPTADVKLDATQRAALNSGFELTGERATTVRRVVVELDHPSLWDRLLNAAPSLILAGLLLLLAYSLWRIEVNTTAGPHQRPFTEKDERWLSRTARSLWWLWWLLAAAEVWGSHALHLGGGALVGPVSQGSVIVLGLALLVGMFSRVYRKAHQAYSDLEKIV
ncbi:hypothetical protein [Streptomyces sp. NPDC059783]|uniref:hypothetical protein n=1 Tax=Streptomyces sp. NPDC059783 TaxID=3346944 RepID=UPI003648D98B